MRVRRSDPVEEWAKQLRAVEIEEVAAVQYRTGFIINLAASTKGQRADIGNTRRGGHALLSLDITGIHTGIGDVDSMRLTQHVAVD
jgi:hypothetical protein